MRFEDCKVKETLLASGGVTPEFVQSFKLLIDNMIDSMANPPDETGAAQPDMYSQAPAPDPTAAPPVPAAPAPQPVAETFKRFQLLAKGGSKILRG